MIRILYNGEELFVNSIAGHEGCTILDANAAEPSAVSDRARRDGMTKAELFEEAVQTAREQVIGELEANGVISGDVADSMRSGAAAE